MFKTKTVSSVTAKLAKIAQDLREVEVAAQNEAAEAQATLTLARSEQATAAKVASNIEALLS